MILVSAAVAMSVAGIGFDRAQIISCAIFILIIMATLLFWEFRLAIAFVDNIVFVAAFMPVVNKLEQTPLLWACCRGRAWGVTLP